METETFHIQYRWKGGQTWMTPEGHYVSLKSAMLALKVTDRTAALETRIIRVDRAITVLWTETKDQPVSVDGYDGAMILSAGKRVHFFPMSKRREKELKAKGYQKTRSERFPAWVKDARAKRVSAALLKANLSAASSPTDRAT